MSQVTIIDSGIGNLLSVCRAFEYVGASVQLTQDPNQVAKANRLVLPGVGAFQEGMDKLNQMGLVEAIKNHVSKERPLLGICLGMQFLLDSSEEFGATKGLGIISGKIKKIPNKNDAGELIKIPHIGWNSLIKNQKDWKASLLEKTTPGDAVYFVHSYQAVLENSAHCLAKTDYEGVEIPAVIKKNNSYGCQFHPEKSGPVGLKIIERFAN